MIPQAFERLPPPPAVAAARRIVVKPKFVSTVRPLAATPVEALEAVLRWLREHGATHVTVADGTASEATFDGFAAYGYFGLGRLPGLRVDFVDLNQDAADPVTIYDRSLTPRTIRLARTVTQSDLLVSVTRPKTHDAVIVTGALKNVLMGSPVNRRAGGPRWRAHLSNRLMRIVPSRLRSIQGLATLHPSLADRLYASDKAAVHQGFPVINLNLFLLARAVRPRLAVLDGLVGMEGDGPIFGQPVHLGWAAASTDAVATDAVMAHLMGHDPAGVGYLHYCQRAGLGEADLAAIEVLGPPLASLQRPCRPSSTLRQQQGWADPAVERLFQSLLATAPASASPAA
jgi:uncharacterized protein (DUF362 family)